VSTRHAGVPQADGDAIEPASSQRDRIPVLLIAGAARSGSTVLDRVIGTHDGFCSMGELQFIWQRSFGENQLCGCGLPFHECAFWREVSVSAFGVEPRDVDVDAATRLKAFIDDKRHLQWLVLKAPPRFRSELLAYGDLLERLYSAVLRVSGARVVVDSSKDPRHGFVLSRLKHFDVHVVHLIRDPRAVAFSWKRTRRRPEIHWKSQDMMIQQAGASSARWTVHNAFVELLSGSAASYCRVRYEDFVVNPAATVSRILAPYEWLSERPAAESAEPVVLETAHTVAGNPMRFKGGPLNIALDDEWRISMPAHDRALVTAATWPLLLRYGYSLRA
jgi:Sulfotransferase family